MLWTKSESNSKPDTVLQLGGERILVRKNITEELSAEGNVKYCYEERIMTSMEYSILAAMDAKEVKRESEIIDEYTLKLIEEGVI